jgi:hypothetical protein
MTELIAQTDGEASESVLKDQVGCEDNSGTFRHADHSERYSQSMIFVDSMPNGDPPSSMLWGTEE